METLSQIRREIRALQRKHARGLALFRLHPVAEEIAADWQVAVVEKEPLPEPEEVIQDLAKAGFRFPTYTSLSQYLARVKEERRLLDPDEIVHRLLPWSRQEPYVQKLRWGLPGEAYAAHQARKEAGTPSRYTPKLWYIGKHNGKEAYAC